MSPEKFHALTGYQFKQVELLEQALTHRSYARGANNERLEFLGDSVLGLVISKHIYQRFADASEGELSRLRASLVKEATLAKVAREIQLGDHLRLGSGSISEMPKPVCKNICKRENWIYRAMWWKKPVANRTIRYLP